MLPDDWHFCKEGKIIDQERFHDQLNFISTKNQKRNFLKIKISLNLYRADFTTLRLELLVVG